MIRQLAPLVFLYDGERVPIDLPERALALRALRTEAFGDGSHPTTRLCAGAVDFLVRQSLGSTLDVGTGTGVLARIARARGSRFVAATDIDPAALESAQAHAALDPAARETEIANRPPDYWGARFDLVVANILEAPLRVLSEAVVRALAPGGTLLISGYTRMQAPFLHQLYRERGLEHISDATMEDWVMSRFRRI